MNAVCCIWKRTRAAQRATMVAEKTSKSSLHECPLFRSPISSVKRYSVVYASASMPALREIGQLFHLDFLSPGLRIKGRSHGIIGPSKSLLSVGFHPTTAPAPRGKFLVLKSTPLTPLISLLNFSISSSLLPVVSVPDQPP